MFAKIIRGSLYTLLALLVAIVVLGWFASDDVGQQGGLFERMLTRAGSTLDKLI